MGRLIFDIETVGEDFDALDEVTQEALTHWIAGQPEEQHERLHEYVRGRLGFSPFTGEIVAIGVMDDERAKGTVYFQAPGKALDDTTEGDFTLRPLTEREMLIRFWEGAKEYDEFVTFNGRCFDAPFLMIRSAVHGIRPSVNLMSNRYLGMQRGVTHVDLMDQLQFYGATRRPNIHLACRAFGITSPKAQGTKGDDVAGLFEAQEYLDIARYNVGDLVATRELYRTWEKYLRF